MVGIGENDMTREFVLMPEFEKQWKNMGLNDDDLHRLQDELLKNPMIGSVMRGTGSLRKMRFALEGKGKSGSSRILYVDFVVHEIIFLIYAYPKNEKENISKEERNLYRRLIAQIGENLGRKIK